MRRWGVAGGLTVVAVMGIGRYMADRAFLVVGRSMMPTLHHDDLVWLDQCGKETRCRVGRGDLVVAHVVTATGTELMIKRVVGLPGDTIRMAHGRLLVNADTVVVRDATTTASPPTWVLRRLGAVPAASGANGVGSWGPLSLTKDEYFVVGDNPSASRDSRHFGPIPTRDVLAASARCVRASTVVWRLRLPTLCRTRAGGQE